MTFKLKYCGICHTDVHVADNDLGRTQYPCVPGHELAGIVSAVGSNVTEYKVENMHFIDKPKPKHSTIIQFLTPDLERFRAL